MKLPGQGFGIYNVDGRVSYEPPKPNTIKRMCLSCRRREVSGKAQYCGNAICERARRKKLDDLGHTA